MFVLFETPMGYALFKLLDKGKLKSVDSVTQAFATPESAASMVKLKHFYKFDDTTKALSAATSICDDSLDENLQKFLTDNLKPKAKVAVGDIKLGQLLKNECGLKAIFDQSVEELMRGIRSQLSSLVGGVSEHDREAMRLGLSHSLCRYKLKFSPDKVDTMIIQAIALLDELDKELNTYAMRVREWYGWHFPEMGKIVTDNIQYAKVVLKMGVRSNASETDLSDILEEDTETEVKEAAEVSMGTEVATEDIEHIQELCTQVIELSTYRGTLFEYLKNRMRAIAPNLTCMVGELVGARLIAHAGSLISLAKHPASTVQILGAEKALFRALKTKHDTPKYGLIYHASLVGQAAPKLKGKISRVLAAKTSLAVRTDALGDSDVATIGITARQQVENRLIEMEGGTVRQLSGTANGTPAADKYQAPASTATYNDASDAVLASATVKKEKKEKKKKKKKRKAEEVETPAAAAPAAVEEKTPSKEKKKKKKKKESEAVAPAATHTPKKQKTVAVEATPEKKKKKKKRKADALAATPPPAAVATPSTDKKKKKKKKTKKVKTEA